MKGITVFFLTVGLASAQASPAPIAVNGGPVDPNALNSSSINLGNVSDTSEINSGGATGANLNLGSVLGGSGDSSSSLVNPNTNLQGLDASGLNLGSGLDLGDGLDLGSLDFNNQADILNAIQLMMNSLCLGGLVQEAQLQQLGQAAQVEMLLELAQLMSLMQAGLINLSEIQGLSAAGLLFSGFNIAGVLRRELGTNGRTTRRLKGRQILEQQACQAGAIVPANTGIASGLAPVSATGTVPAAGSVGEQVAAIPGDEAAPVTPGEAAAALGNSANGNSAASDVQPADLGATSPGLAATVVPAAA